MARPDSSSSRVYIGHCEADTAAATTLATALRDEHGIDVWLEDWSVGLGQVTVLEESKGIAQAQVFLLVLSPEALRDEWMDQRSVAVLRQAIAREGTRAIPVRLGGLTQNELPLFLASRRSAPIDAVAAIASAITEILGPPSSGGATASVATRGGGRTTTVVTEEPVESSVPRAAVARQQTPPSPAPARVVTSPSTGGPSSSAPMDARRSQTVLEGVSVEGWDGVYVLGCIDRRVTVYSQQVRALNVAAALIASARVRPGDPVVVVGAGAAGLTCAAGLLHLGADVTVLEARDEILPLFRGGSTRWLHPGVYDWPLPGWQLDRAGLPLLDWAHGSVDAVREQLETGWAAAGGVDRVRHGVRLVRLGQPKDTKRAVTWSPRGKERVKTVVLAVGFGLEAAALPNERRYWESDDLDASRIDGKERTWLVSGCGDGGLTDLLRLCLKGFRHDRMLHDFTRDPRTEGIRAEIRRIEGDAAIQDDPATLHDAYADLEASWVVDAMQERRRGDEVKLAAPNADFLTRGASPLNRFLAGQLYRAGMFELVPSRVASVDPRGAEVVVTFEDATTETFDRVVRRHGPTPALDEHFPLIAKALEGDRGMRRAKPTLMDQTRERLWAEGVFGPEVRVGSE